MIKRLIAILLCLLVASPAWAAVARVGAGTTGSGADDFAFDVVVGSGSNRALFLLCQIDQNNRTLTATYNGVAMSSVGTKQHSTISTGSVVLVLVNPASGTNSLSTNISAAIAYSCIAFDFTGVDQVTPASGVQTVEALTTDTSSAVSVTCAAGNYAFDIMGSSSPADFTADGENSEVTEFDTASITLSTSEDATPDGTVNMSWSFTNENTTQIGFCINAAATVTVIPAAPIFFQ